MNEDRGGDRDQVGRGVAVLLTAAAVVAAVLGGRASLVSSASGDARQRAVREEVKRSAALIEDVRFVFADEAMPAFLVAAAGISAEELRAEAQTQTGTVRTALLAEAEGRDTLAETVAKGVDLVEDPSYRTQDGGFDLGRRLVDVRARNRDLATLDPEVSQREGDDAAERARFGVASTIPAAVAFLFGAVAQGFPARRRVLLFVGWGVLGAAVVAGLLVELVVA